MCQEQTETGRSCSCFCGDERAGLAVYRVARSAAMRMKTSLSVAKPRHRWVRALKYNPINQPSRWLAEWFAIVILSSTIRGHSANQWLGRLIGRTSTATGTPCSSPHPRLFPLVRMEKRYLGITFVFTLIPTQTKNKPMKTSTLFLKNQFLLYRQYENRWRWWGVEHALLPVL